MIGKPRNAPASSIRAYLEESARPLVSLIFVAPMLLLYEAGVVFLGESAIRNAADIWLRQLLDLLGFGQYFLLPLFSCGILLAWHYVSRYPWQVRASVLYGMLLECLLLSSLLLILAGWQSRLFSAQLFSCAAETESASGLPSLLIGFIGAGIYEELLFRLMLLPTAVGLLRLAGFSPRASLATAVIAVSLLFAAAHYHIAFELAGRQFATTYGESFEWFSFTFRFVAGVFFSLLFAFRGFGVAVGTHAVYDIFTLLV